jgi:hypothetical protein
MGRDRCSTASIEERGEGWRKWEKREGKKGRERKLILEMREGKKKKKKLKKWGQLIFFYLMKSYNNISFVKSYCSNLAI